MAEQRRRCATAGLSVALGAALMAPTVAVAAPAAPTATVIEQSYTVGAGQPFSAVLATHGLGRAAGLTAVIAVHDPVDLATTDDPLAILDTFTTTEPPTGSPTDEVEVDIDVGADSTVDLAIPVTVDDTATADALDAAKPGVAPVTITIRRGEHLITSTSTFVSIVDDSTVPATRVALLAGVADPGPTATDEQRERASAELDTIVELADAVDAPLTLQVPPMIATEHGGLQEAFVGDQLLALPSLPFDPSSIAAIERNALFVDRLVDGERLLADAAPLARRGRGAWTVDAPLTAAGGRLLRDLGTQVLVVDPTTTDGWTDGATADMFAVELGVRDLPGVVVSPLGEALAAPSSSPGEANSRAVAVLATLSVLRRHGDHPVTALGLPGLAAPDPAVTAQLADYASSSSEFLVVTAGDLAGPIDRAITSGSVTTVAPVDEPEVDLSGRADQVESMRYDLNSAAAMLVDDSPAVAWQADFDSVLAATVDEAEAQATLDRIGKSVAAVFGSIEAPLPVTLNFTGASTRVPVTLRNNGAVNLEVAVRLRSPKLEVLEQPVVTVEAGGETSVAIPVRARSNGTFTIEVDIISPNGRRIVGPVIVTADVAQTSGLSKVVTVGAVLALGSWWVSHWRKSRAKRAGEEGAEGPLASSR